MAGSRPKFLDSPYFVDEPGNWHLKPGAPEDVKKEFDEFMLEDEPRSLDVIKALTQEELSRL